MPEHMSRLDWLHQEIEIADDYVERHANDDDPVLRAHAERRRREAAAHRTELATHDRPASVTAEPNRPATQPADHPADLADQLVGRDVTVRYPGPYGVTTIHSSVTDVSVDGEDIEVAAAPGHLFPLDTVTFTDDLDEQPPDTATRPVPEVEGAGWGPPNQFDAPRYPKPLAPPGTVSLDAWRAADPRRHGAEVGFGDLWTFDDPNDWYSIAWNVATGELYTYRQKDRTVLVRAVLPNRAAVDAVLHGWQHDQFREGSAWEACARIASHTTVEPAADPAATTARDLALRWHTATASQPTEPPLGLA